MQKRRTKMSGKRKGVRRRDILIFVSCLAAIVLSFQNEGTISFKPGFTVPWEEDTEVERLPKPLIVDLNSDGTPEMVAVTGPEKVTVFESFSNKRAVGGYVQELAGRTSAHLHTNIIGLAAGYLQHTEAWKRAHAHHTLKPHNATTATATTAAPPDGEDPRLLQHIVVVTDDYVVTMYDASLTYLWAVRLPVPHPRDNFMYDEFEDAEELYSWYVPVTAVVMVLPNKVYEDDKGMVVIGVEADLPMDNEEFDDAEMGTGVRHMTYFALSGTDGALRWAHNTTDDIDSSQDSSVKVQHSYKLTLQHLEHHAMEQDWRYYRMNIIAALPHSFTHHHDLKMQLHRFAPKKNRKKKPAATTSYKEVDSFLKQKTKDRSKTSNTYGSLGEKVWALLQWRKRRNDMPMANVVLVHRAQGLEAIHLYTGKTLAQVGPLKEGWLYDDVNDDTVLDGMTSFIGDTEGLDTYSKNWANQKTLCKGVGFSGIPIGEKPLFNRSICTDSGMLHSLEFLKAILKGEDDDEGVKINLLGGISIAGVGSRDHFDESLSAVPPISIYRIDHGRTDVVYFISSGLVTCVNGKTGGVRWRVDTPASFGKHAANFISHFLRTGHEGHMETALRAEHREKELEALESHAHLKAYALHTPTEPDPQENVVTIRNVYNVYPTQYVLAIGHRKVAVLNAGSGALEHQFVMDSPPLAPVTIVDFNGDGLNDLVFITKSGIVGHLAVSRKGASVVTATLTCVMALLALLFLTHSSIQGTGARVKLARSTD